MTNRSEKLFGARDTFLEAFNAVLLTEAEFAGLTAMIEDRNNTSHTYNEDLAETIAHHLPGYYALMMAIARRTFVQAKA